MLWYHNGLDNFIPEVLRISDRPVIEMPGNPSAGSDYYREWKEIEKFEDEGIIYCDQGARNAVIQNRRHAARNNKRLRDAKANSSRKKATC